MKEEYEVEPYTTRCLGEDFKIHLCEPHKDVTLCGVKIRSKSVEDSSVKRFSCYECTY